MDRRERRERRGLRADARVKASTPEHAESNDRRTAESRTARCGGCDNSWTGRTAAHCSTCHFTWSSVSGFDAHSVGPVDARRCRDPRTARNAAGELIFEPMPRKWGTAYRVRRDRSGEGARWYQEEVA